MRRLVLLLAVSMSLASAAPSSAAPKKKKAPPPPPPPDKTEQADDSKDKSGEGDGDKDKDSDSDKDKDKASTPTTDAGGASTDSSEKTPNPNAPAGKVEGADDTLDTIEGIHECEAFELKNAHDMQIWEKTQPATPYKYPERKTFLDAPWTPITKLDGDSGMLLIATLAPHLNAMIRDATPAVGFSWPWELPVGPAFWCTRKKGTYDLFKYRPVRIVLEPGIYAEQPVTFFVRPGARFMWHPTSWYFGAGLGAGSTLEIAGKEPFRASLSPEAIVTFGRCCNPGYFTIAVRHDFFFAGKTQTTTASLGFNYF
ncbi:MAG: hypothetical protein ACRELY_27635 [Polyangiaceae bacterium]